MATINKLPSGNFRVRWRTPGGRQSAVFARRNDAATFAKIKEAEVARGVYIDPKSANVPFAQWADEWLQMRVNLKPKTRAGYESLLRSHLLPEFRNISIGSIRPVHVRDWVASMDRSGLSASRIRQAYQLLSSVLKSAVEAEFLNRTPCLGVKLPRPRTREMQFLDADQIGTLAGTIREPYSTLVYRNRSAERVISTSSSENREPGGSVLSRSATPRPSIVSPASAIFMTRTRMS